MDHESIIKHQAQALESSNAALPKLFKDAMQQERLQRIIEKEYFDPNEDQEIAHWFSRFNTIRQDLWSTIESGIYYTGGMDKLANAHDYQYFVLGYSAVCSLIRMDQFLLNKVATHSVIQRKLNQAFPAHQVERKQFSEIYKGLVQPSNAIRIHHAHRLLNKRKEIIHQAVANSPAESTFKRLSQQERYIDLSRKNYVFSWLKSQQLIWRRRGASARQKVLFVMLEIGGRIAAELGLPRPKKVTASIRNEVKEIIQAGDFFVTRHNHALTNLFLPGFWPHTALYIGDEHDRDTLGINTEESSTNPEESSTNIEKSQLILRSHQLILRSP